MDVVENVHVPLLQSVTKGNAVFHNVMGKAVEMMDVAECVELAQQVLATKGNAV
jgi:hypothetical protein